MTYDPQRPEGRGRPSRDNSRGKACTAARALTAKFVDWCGADARISAGMAQAATNAVLAGQSPEQAAERAKRAWYIYRRGEGLPPRNEPADPEQSRDLLDYILGGLFTSPGMPPDQRVAKLDGLEDDHERRMRALMQADRTP